MARTNSEVNHAATGTIDVGVDIHEASMAVAEYASVECRVGWV
jgi:hypothetical protein